MPRGTRVIINNALTPAAVSADLQLQEIFCYITAISSPFAGIGEMLGQHCYQLSKYWDSVF